MENFDISALSKELESIASKWEDLGSRLQISPETIQSLKSESCPDEDGLREVLRQWLETDEQRDLEVLTEAVSGIDQHLADSLKGKFCSTGEGEVEVNDKTATGEEVATVSEKPSADDGGAVKLTEELEESSAHLYSEKWSKLSREDVIDKIKGVIYGQAIGDAFGLATEFMGKEEAKAYYKDGLKGYEDIVPDFHRSRWDKGDWTDDTDQMLLIMLMVIETNGRVDQLNFASRIHNWMCHGFAEFGDIGGMGIGQTVKRTLTHPAFLKEPVKAANDVWESSGRYLAANGAIMRTSILGILSFNAMLEDAKLEGKMDIVSSSNIANIPKVVANTKDIAKVTHADPRCAASCVAVTTAIALMLQGAYDPTKKSQLSALIERAITEGNKSLEHKDQQKEMKKYINGSLKDLKLGDRKTIGYTFKALGSGFYGLRKGTDFRKTITEIIMEGGDADSNAAVCGALMGCKLGFKSLPEDLLQFKHREWLDKKVDDFLKITGLA